MFEFINIIKDHLTPCHHFAFEKRPRFVILKRIAVFVFLVVLCIACGVFYVFHQIYLFGKGALKYWPLSGKQSTARKPTATSRPGT